MNAQDRKRMNLHQTTATHKGTMGNGKQSMGAKGCVGTGKTGGGEMKGSQGSKKS